MEYQEMTAEDYVAILDNEDSNTGRIEVPYKILREIHEDMLGFNDMDDTKGARRSSIADRVISH